MPATGTGCLCHLVLLLGASLWLTVLGLEVAASPLIGNGDRAVVAVGDPRPAGQSGLGIPKLLATCAQDLSP